MSKQAPLLNALTPQEEDVMRAYWEIGEGEISDIIPHMFQKEMPYTTVASIVSKLEGKGYLEKCGRRRGFVYRALVSDKDYSEKTLKYVVSNFFTGSYKDMVQYFARKQKISSDDLKEILEMIEKGEEEQ